MRLQVSTGDRETDRHVRALGRCAYNLAVQQFRSQAYWIFHGVYDVARGAVRQSAALSYLDSNIPKRIKRRVEVWLSEEQRQTIFVSGND